MTGTQRSSGGATATPVLPSANAPAAATALRDLRRWQLGAGTGTPLPADALPALLAPFRDPSRVRNDFPLVIERTPDGLRARPLGDVLPEIAQHGKTQARIVQDNLPRLERRMRVLLAQQPSAGLRDLLRTAGSQTIAELQLRDTIAAGLKTDLESMAAAVPAAELLGLQPATPLALLLAAARQRAAVAGERFKASAKAHAEALSSLLQVEAQKDPEARSATSLQKSLGTASGQFLDTSALARNVGQHRGSLRADPERRQRLQNALAALEQHLAAPALPPMVLVHQGQAPALPGVEAIVADDVCTAAAQQFDRLAATLLAAMRAMQLAELEQRSAYDPERHDPRLAAMRWQDLAAEDLALLPVVAVLVPASALAGRSMQSLTSLLVSQRPVQVIALQAPVADPVPGEDGQPHSRLELGYLGIGFRDAYVQQSTAARPSHLLAGFVRALRGRRPGLHVVDPGLAANGAEPPLGAFLHAGASIEGRANPLFQYDPEAGETWARRLDFALNPAPEADWPLSDLSARAAGGGDERLQLAFTFADCALLEPTLRGSFALVPDSLRSDELVPLAEWLQMPTEAATRALPFVWVACGSGAGTLHRALVQRPLVQACQDRLRFWRTLQELAGVRNEYVREAVQRARQEAAEQAAREQQALQAQHEQQLEQVRAEATGQAMQGLARMLLEIDPVGEAPVAVARPPRVAAAATAAAAPAEAAPAAPAAQAAPAPAAAPADDGPEEPWIDSVRCSTCNDCVNLNPLLFVYNENKQARIGNAQAGTYAQIVAAAEKCPSRCIHPGKPMNPAEPGLDALIARAQPFNR